MSLPIAGEAESLEEDRKGGETLKVHLGIAGRGVWSTGFFTCEIPRVPPRVKVRWVCGLKWVRESHSFSYAVFSSTLHLV